MLTLFLISIMTNKMTNKSIYNHVAVQGSRMACLPLLVYMAYLKISAIQLDISTIQLGIPANRQYL